MKPISYGGLAELSPRPHRPSRWRAVCRKPRQPPRLSPQQRRILAVLSEGMELKEAAYAASITPRTAKHYMHLARRRLGMRSTLQLAVAMARGEI